jgi:hypothetical protein
VLNHPSRALRRYDLLRALHAAGVNRFNAYRLSDRGQARFPAFLRLDNAHTGSLTPLLNSRDEMENAVDGLPGCVDRDHVIAVEYCHTGDASGTFRKYSFMRIGERMVARHVLFSHDWVDKHPDLVSPEHAAEEQQYLAANPHVAEIERVFRLANIEYGRMDYGLLEGAIQVWEINTNPIIMVPPGQIAATRLCAQAQSGAAITAALDAIDTPTAPSGIRVSVPREIEAAAGVGLPHRALRLAGRATRRAQRLRPVRAMLQGWDRLMDAYVRY